MVLKGAKTKVSHQKWPINQKSLDPSAKDMKSEAHTVRACLSSSCSSILQNSGLSSTEAMCQIRRAANSLAETSLLSLKKLRCCLSCSAEAFFWLNLGPKLERTPKERGREREREREKDSSFVLSKLRRFFREDLYSCHNAELPTGLWPSSHPARFDSGPEDHGRDDARLEPWVVWWALVAEGGLGLLDCWMEDKER